MMRFVYYALYATLVAAGLLVNRVFIYVLFLTLIGTGITKGIRGNKNRESIWITVLLYSLMLPDNYSTEAVFILYFVLVYLFGHRFKIRKTRYTLWMTLLLGLSILTSFINNVPGTNLVFSFISFAPFLIFLLIAEEKAEPVTRINKSLDNLLFVETVATIINYLLYRGKNIDDWSCGTLSRVGGQQAQLFIISAFLVIHYYSLYAGSKDKKQIFKMLIALLIAISTNCWALLAVFIIGVGISLILTLNIKKLILSVILIICLPFLVGRVLAFLPDSISGSLSRMMNDSSYFKYRFHKAITYEDTFVEIPKRDLKFAIIGNGLGYYNSRAALICTGEYVSFYNRLFSPSVSRYTNEYVLDYVVLGNKYGDTDYASVLARPYSSIMALMGECGYLGIILFTLCMICLLRKKNYSVRAIIIIWLCFCTVENYFEYSKVIILAYICLKQLGDLRVKSS